MYNCDIIVLHINLFYSIVVYYYPYSILSLINYFIFSHPFIIWVGVPGFASRVMQRADRKIRLAKSETKLDFPWGSK